MLTPFLLHTCYTEQSMNLFGLVERLARTLRLKLHRGYTDFQPNKLRVLWRTSLPHRCPYPPIIEKTSWGRWQWPARRQRFTALWSELASSSLLALRWLTLRRFVTAVSNLEKWNEWRTLGPLTAHWSSHRASSRRSAGVWRLSFYVADKKRTAVKASGSSQGGNAQGEGVIGNMMNALSLIKAKKASQIQINAMLQSCNWCKSNDWFYL